MKRLLEVGSTLGVWFAAGQLSSSMATATAPRTPVASTLKTKAKSDQRAAQLRRILTKLGPTFIKIGQALSSRPDTLPPEILQELEKLQDQLPPFPTEAALQVIADDMGRPVGDIFSSISEIPVAAASLGQVYKAKLRATGEEVAVKVQRPGVRTSIALDVLVLRQLAVGVRRWGKLNSDLPALLDEWAASLFRELDYCTEAENGVKFAQLYSHLEGVYVPRMYTEVTTPRVLVMEWVDGERLRTAYTSVSSGSSSSSASSAGGGIATSASVDSVDGAAVGVPVDGNYGSSDDLRLVEIGVRCSLEQLLEYGFYHADPHPGNLLKTKDGNLAYLDFGMMGTVSESVRQGLIRATLHLVNREYAALAEDFITLGMLPSDSDRSEIVPALTSVFAEALAGGVDNLSFGDLSGKLGRTMYQYKFQIPSYYTLLVRSLSVLEGIALASDPSYKVLSAAYPWVARRLLTDTSPELRSTLTSLLYKEGKFNFKRMESLLVQAAKPTGRPQPPPRSQASPQQQQSQQQQPLRGDALALILSPQGEFVRGIVVEELAKGADAAWRLAIDAAVAEGMSRGGAGAVELGGMSPAMAKMVVDMLAAVPGVSDAQDAEQVEGLTRLARAIQQTAAVTGSEGSGGTKGNASNNSTNAGMRRGDRKPSQQGKRDESPTGNVNVNACSVAMERLQNAAELLQWSVRELATLGPAEQAEALKLPLEVAEVAASRVVARGVRWVLGSDGESQKAGAGETKERGGSSRVPV